jgi:hypothetical protein
MRPLILWSTIKVAKPASRIKAAQLSSVHPIKIARGTL